MKVHYIFVLQGLYYLTTGMWPLISMKNFERVTGKKKDHWLVYTVAGLIVCSSVIFLYSGFRSMPVPTETIILSVTNALALTLVDIIFVFRHTISKIYLLDASLEILLLISIATEII